MSFFSSASSLNSFLAWSMGNGGGGRVPIEFPLVLDWYKEQPCKKFGSFQHRKEPHGFRHEYIALNLTDGGVCRIERTGDPNARFDALSSQGSVAHDFAQCFRQKDMEKARLGTSEVIAEVRLPHQLDILDVLRICHAVRQGEKSHSYTLQVFNCFFFSLAIQSCLTRLVAKWDETVPRNQWALRLEQAVRSAIGNYHEPAITGIGNSIPILFRAYLALRSNACTLVDRDYFLQQVQSAVENHADLHEGLRSSLDGVLWYYNLPIELCRLAQQVTKSAWLQPLTVGFIMRVSTMGSPSSLSTNNPPASDSPVPGVPAQESLEPLKRNCMTVLMELVRKADRAPGITSTRTRVLRPIANRCNRLTDRSMSTNTDHCRNHASKQADFQSITMVEWMLILWAHIKNLLQWVFYPLRWPLEGLSLGGDLRHNSPIPIEKELERMLFRLEGSEHIGQQDLINFLHALEALRDNPRAIWNEYPWAQVSQEANRTLSNSEMGVEISVLQVNFNASPEYNECTASEFQVYISERIRLQAELMQKVWLGSSTYIETELWNNLSRVWASIRNDEPITVYGYTGGDGPNPGDGPTPGDNPMVGNNSSVDDDSTPGHEPTGGNGPPRGDAPARGDELITGNDPTAGPHTCVSSPSTLPTSLIRNAGGVLPLFSRPYGRHQLRSSGYHDQLNTWSTRIRIPNIQFQIRAFRDGSSQQMWEAIPIFPRIYLLPTPLHQSHVGHGQSREEAQAASRHTLRNASWRDEDIQLVRWSFVEEGRGYTAVPHHYGPPALLEDPEVIGVGSSKASAVERSARGLLLSEYYCVTW